KNDFYLQNIHSQEDEEQRRLREDTVKQVWEEILAMCQARFPEGSQSIWVPTFYDLTRTEQQRLIREVSNGSLNEQWINNCLLLQWKTVVNLRRRQRQLGPSKPDDEIKPKWYTKLLRQ